MARLRAFLHTSFTTTPCRTALKTPHAQHTPPHTQEPPSGSAAGATAVKRPISNCPHLRRGATRLQPAPFSRPAAASAPACHLWQSPLALLLVATIHMQVCHPLCSRLRTAFCPIASPYSCTPPCSVVSLTSCRLVGETYHSGRSNHASHCDHHCWYSFMTFHCGQHFHSSMLRTYLPVQLLWLAAAVGSSFSPLLPPRPSTKP